MKRRSPPESHKKNKAAPASSIGRVVLPRPDDLPADMAWLHSDAMEAAYDRSVLLSDMRQMRLQLQLEALRKANPAAPPGWKADIGTRTLTLAGTAFRIVLMGTTNPVSWIFACAGHPNGFEEGVYKDSETVRSALKPDIPEFQQDRIAFADMLSGDSFGFRMSAILSTKIEGCKAFYRMPTGPGCAAWAAIVGLVEEGGTDRPLPSLLNPEPEYTAGQILNEARLSLNMKLQTGPRGDPWLWPMSLRLCVEGVLQHYKVPYEFTEGKLRALDGKLEVTFDDLGRITGLSQQIEAGDYSEVVNLMLKESREEESKEGAA
uniref:Uncharacterized protein n=1 Tax=Chromera velia CCMP2878 TaxID=1169474 RepID=A0A0G4HWI9_9ALVE|eukprot:Cvel_9056.t1-p1 / transcript=Cvel_9056.t1 / gene=Cvel_9056 / organism=Chromera_velia_CCMP2878 / gene_product=hypothetical protein / transcript_product=hypothetical protein / location=Cvel_scaffold513:68835-69788(+) / protein_length=318 / sequence_SO=supercontig / SO=protein_coding / is_pseudo=false